MESSFRNCLITRKNYQTIIWKSYLSFETSVRYMSREYSMEVVACCISNFIEVKLIW